MIFLVLRFAIPIVSVINNQIYDTITEENIENKMATISSLTAETSNFDVLNKTIQEAEKATETPQKLQPKKNQPQDGSNGILGSVGKAWDATVEKTGNVYNSATDSAGKAIGSIKKKVDLKRIGAKIEQIKKETTEASDHLIDLAVIFVFQTIISPLVVLWGLLKMVGYLMGAKARVVAE